MMLLDASQIMTICPNKFDIIRNEVIEIFYASNG